MFMRLTLKPFAEVGMGYRNKCLGPFGYRLSLQVHDAIFGDYIHHVSARRGDNVAWCQVQHNAAAAFTPFVVRGGQTDKRLASLRCIGTTHKLPCPPVPLM